MENTNFAEEFEGTEALENEQVATDAPEVVKAPKERETYELADGSIGSRAAFIREKFVNDNMSRKQISEQYGFDYRVVYSATVNMHNNAEGDTRGRSAANAMIKVNADNQVVEVKEIDGAQVTFGNGEATDVTYEEDQLTDKLRNEWIQEAVAAGMSRGDVAKILDVSYGVVYGLTKDAEGTRQTYTITLEDGTEISRAAYIRRQAAAGVSRGDIAKELGVPYSVVWQATKTEKSDQEKYEDAIKTLEHFAGKTSDEEAFADAIATLKAIQIPVKEAEATEEAVETATEGTEGTEEAGEAPKKKKGRKKKSEAEATEEAVETATEAQ